MNRTVCFLLPTHWEFKMGGSQYQAKLLLEHMLTVGGYDLHYFARRLPEDFVADGYEICRFGTSTGMNFMLDGPGLIRELKRIRPDAIYHQVGSAHTGIAAWYCKKYGAKLVWHLASDVDVEPWSAGQRNNLVMSYLDKLFLEYGLRHSTVIVGQTEHQKNLLLQHYGRHIDAVVGNFHPPPVETLDKSGPFQVVWVANFKDVKQPEKFVELAESLADTDLQFLMVGEIKFGETRWGDLAKRIDAMPNVSYTGSIDQVEVNKIIASSHLLVNTSIYEGFSNTFIQAWQREVPVYSLAVNPDGLLGDPEMGFCAGGDFSLLAAEVRRLADDRARRDQVGRSAKLVADEKFGMDNAARLAALL